MRYKSPKNMRLKHRRDISRVFERGSRAGDGMMTLLAARSPEGVKYARGGVAVGKGHGPAVVRNRIKRLCREAMRLTRPELPQGFDYMIVPRRGADLSLEKLQKSLRRLAPKAAANAAGQQNESSDKGDTNEDK